ncbi:hypothetical protein M404DRAFT_1004403 [Pisolithus tinctorius Marx 270]|uniref:Uncharacterized protein n=1 Tax=Pisolithus tinctorius Marx 270 TaxID=870435 RepID=A0A0C3NWW6_PISTI|nr:hypothetical protein M404DRAFT_1004403 [Pisolithus tinctorius Marx 270]
MDAILGVSALGAGVGETKSAIGDRTVSCSSKPKIYFAGEVGCRFTQRSVLVSIPAIGCAWLGIAQLCLLLVVLVFMGFTRGAPYVEQFPEFNHSAC